MFKTKKSAVRRRLEALLAVHRTWFEWTVDGQMFHSTLVIEVTFDTDPGSASFYKHGLDLIHAALAPLDDEKGSEPAHVRIIPRM